MSVVFSASWYKTAGLPRSLPGQGCPEARWHPGQETSLAPSCSNPRPFGSKFTILKYLRHRWDFQALPSDTGGIVHPLPSLVTPPLKGYRRFLKLCCIGHALHVALDLAQGVTCGCTFHQAGLKSGTPECR